jgi:hypothetical protein
MGGGVSVGPGRSVSRPGYVYSPTYQTARALAPTTPSYRAAPQYAHANTTVRAAPMVAASRPMMTARGMKGLGAGDMGAAFAWFFAAAAAAAVTPAAVAGWITRRKTKSWSKAFTVAAGVAAFEVAAVAAYNQRFQQRLRAIQTIERNYSDAQIEAIRTHAPPPPRPAALESQGRWANFIAPLMPVPT